jgi:hypothetical protein
MSLIFIAISCIFWLTLKKQKPVNQRFTGFWWFLNSVFAVREGFEPSVQFPVRQFSKLILSASQAPHLYNKKTPFWDCKYSNSAKPSKKYLVY